MRIRIKFKERHPLIGRYFTFGPKAISHMPGLAHSNAVWKYYREDDRRIYFKYIVNKNGARDSNNDKKIEYEMALEGYYKEITDELELQNLHKIEWDKGI